MLNFNEHSLSIYADKSFDIFSLESLNLKNILLVLLGFPEYETIFFSM